MLHPMSILIRKRLLLLFPFIQDRRASGSILLCRSRAILSVLLVTISLFSLTTPFAIPLQAAPEGYVELDGNGQIVASAINQMRAQAGLPPLAINPLLNLAAQNHVNDMVANHNYSHTGIDGSNVRQRVQRTGYSTTSWVSENWVSVSDPAMAIQWWMNSYVHRTNILNGNWHELGIGAGFQPSNNQYIFVAVFSAGESGDSVAYIPPEPEPLPIPAGGLQYQIQPGDTLLSIGLRYGVEWPIIAGANQLSEYSLLQIGQVIRIPGVENVGGYVADEVQAAAQTAPQEDSGDTFVRRYTVQAGDTLAGIATIYELSWQELARENGLGENSVLSVGKELRIPGAVKKVIAPSEDVTATSEPEVSAAMVAEEATQTAEKILVSETVSDDAVVAAAANAPIQPANDTPQSHTVSPGDTIISIALRYNMDWQQLLQLNNLSENAVLQLGQTIRLR